MNKLKKNEIKNTYNKLWNIHSDMQHMQKKIQKKP